MLSNFGNRTHLILKGLGPIGGSGQQPSQQVLKTRLTSVLGQIGADLPFVVINVVTYSRSSPVYDVELGSSASVDALLRSYYRFTRRRDPVARPPELDGVTLYHSVTPGTRVRISLLRVSDLIVTYFKR